LARIGRCRPRSRSGRRAVPTSGREPRLMHARNGVELAPNRSEVRMLTTA